MFTILFAMIHTSQLNFIIARCFLLSHSYLNTVARRWRQQVGDICLQVDSINICRMQIPDEHSKHYNIRYICLARRDCQATPQWVAGTDAPIIIIVINQFIPSWIRVASIGNQCQWKSRQWSAHRLLNLRSISICAYEDLTFCSMSMSQHVDAASSCEIATRCDESIDSFISDR